MGSTACCLHLCRIASNAEEIGVFRESLVLLNIVAENSQSLGGEFWSYVALRSAEQFEADHEFSYAGGSQERREKMGVQMPFLVRVTIGWFLMESHGVRKGRIE